MRIRTTVPIAIVGVALFLAAGPVWAHHAMIAQYALDKPITLRGTLTKMEWINPHGWIHLDVKGADGQTEEWKIETGSPLRMIKEGLKKLDFKPGNQLIVGGWVAKDGTRTAAGWVVTFPDREASSSGQQASFPLGR